jgi:hypothetical protein|tara:strand:+ start:1217 stop:1690 length:474 start_codon:yes stop_codon:yes gene_type:complete
MVVAEILTGIALVQKSVDFIKSNIETASDIRTIAGSIDDLIRGTEECNKARNKKSGTSLADQFGVENVAKEVIDARLAQEKLNEIRTLVDLRFGHGTWASILAERNKRIQEAKRAEIEARRRRQKEMEQFREMLMLGFGVAILIVAALSIAWLAARG